MSNSKSYKWIFRARFRKHSFGWKSQPAIKRIKEALQEKGYSLVPTKIYFKGNYVKVELGLVKGKKNYDKRHALKEKTQKREIPVVEEIKKNNKDLCFIDFEYFGYDDPVKLISDFYYHPGMNLNSIQKEYWLSQMFKIFDNYLFCLIITV